MMSIQTSSRTSQLFLFFLTFSGLLIFTKCNFLQLENCEETKCSEDSSYHKAAEPLSFKRVCYYSSDVLPNEGLQPESIDASLCTHLILFGSFTLSKNGTIGLKENTRNGNILARAQKLKEDNSELKIMAGFCEGFSELVKDVYSIKRFAYNARLLLDKYKLDGVDIDWEFPNYPPSIDKRNEKKMFVILIEELNTALRLMSPSYLLSIAVSSIVLIMNFSYDFPQLNDNVDFVNLMCYDYSIYNKFFPFVGHNAPLFGRSDEHNGYFSTFNTASTASIVNSRGIDRNKLIVGIPTYGRNWTLVSPEWYQIHAPSSGPGSGMGYSNYPEIVNFLKDRAEDLWDCEAKVPFAHHDKQWISYESERSAQLKTKWMMSELLGGVMVFSLNADDWQSGSFPLTTTINRTISGTVLHHIEEESCAVDKSQGKLSHHTSFYGLLLKHFAVKRLNLLPV